MQSLAEIGSEIKSARKRFDLSLEDLSVEAKVSIAHIQNIERGNRAALPEETYLVGFLNKLLRTLKFDNVDEVLNYYRQREADNVVAEIINDSEIIETAKPWSLQVTKYHLYSLLIIGVVLLTWFVFNLSSNRIEPAPTLNLVVDESLETLPRTELPDFVKGKGAKQLDVEVIDNAWYQVIGVNQEQILFEGDVFYDHGYKLFRFFDDTGFVLSTGNAGAFKVKVDTKNFVLGRTSERVQWFYPESIKQFYTPKTAQTLEEPEHKLFGRFRRKKNN